MKPLIFVCLFVALCSCGAQHKLSKAERLIKEAIDKGAKVKDDTVYKFVRFKIPGIAFNTTLIAPNFSDTAYIVGKDSIQLKIVRIPPTKTEPEKIYIEADCPDHEETKKIPIGIDREIKAGYSLWEMIILAIASAAVGYFLGGPIVKGVSWLIKKFFPGL